MSFVFPTNASQVQGFAGALFGVQVGSATMAQVNADILANGGLAKTLNGYYSATFSSTAAAAKAVATNLGLTGAALTEGTAYITSQLNAAAADARGAVISNIVNMFGTYTADATFGAAATAWNTKVASAVAYTGAGNVPIGSVVVTNSVFPLTTGIDNFPGTAGNDQFVATPAAGVDTFTALDSLNGGKGDDILSVAAVAALTIPAGAKVIDIETATLASNTSVTADVSTWTGLTELFVSSGGATTVTAAATTNVTELGSVAASTITGGKDVTVTHATAGTVTVDTAAGAVKVTNNLIGGATNIGVTNAATAVKGAVTVAAKGDVSVAGGTTHDITFAESSAYAARVANAASKLSTAATATSAATAAGSTGSAQLKAAGLTTLTADLTAATTVATNNAATLKALNGGHITTAQKVAIDAAFITAFQVPGALAATAVAAALAVNTPIATAAANAVLAATATSTTAAAASAAATTLNAIDLTGGLGQPNRTLTDTSVNNTALTSVKVTGGYGTGAANITGTALTTVTLDNAAPATLTSNVLTNVSVSNVVGATGNVTIANATVGHTQNLTLSNVGTAATSTVAAARFTATDNAATTVNLVSNGTANNVILAAPAATALNLSGAGSLDAVLAVVGAKAPVIANTVSGQALTAAVAATTASSTLSLATNAVITATNSSGANNVLISAGQSYLGGSGADTVTTGAAVQTVAVSGGEGVADKLIVTNLTNIGVNADGTGSAKFTGFEILETNVTGTIDLATTLKGNTLTSVIIKPVGAADGTTATATINGLNATQANAVTISTAPNATGYTLGLNGATSVGQLDTVTVSAGAALGRLSIAGVETLNITPTAGTSFNYGNAGALSTINVTGGSSAVYVSGEAVALNPNTVIDASKGTGKAILNIISATGNGAKLVGSATANNLLTSNNSSSVLVGGAGNDILRGGNGDDTITAGDGNDTVVAGNGVNSVTLGNGMNTVSGGTGIDTITVGTGTNWIATGGALDVITLGAHALGNSHTIDLTGAGRDVANVVTVNGFNSGVDKINLAGGAGNGVATLNLAATTTQAAMLAPVTDPTSVATLAAVYTALATATGLNNSVGHEFALSSAAAGGLVARTVVYPNGEAAGTYLVINDGVAGFVAADDVVIKLTGKTTVAAGDIVAAGTAYSVTPSQAFTASVGTDNFVGGDQNDTFASTFSGATAGPAVHVLSTFAATDVMNGGANSNLTASSAATPGDVLTISPAGDITTGTTANLTLADADFANKTGIEGLTISSTGVGSQSITLANTNYGAAGFKFLTTSSTSGAITIAAGTVATAGEFKVTTTQIGGNISVTAATAAVAQSITTLVGSGAVAGDSVVTSTTVIVGGAGVDTISATSGTAALPGSGTIAITGGLAADAVTIGVGTGATTINLSAAATGGLTTTVGLDSGYFGLNPTLAGAANTAPTILSANTTSTTTFDVYTGIAAGDKIQLLSTAYTGAAGAALGLIANGVAVTDLTNAALNTAAMTTTGTTDNALTLVRGIYTGGTTNTFVGSTTGTSTLFIYDANATVGAVALEAIVLVGYVQGSVTGIGGASGLVTLA